MQILSPGKLRGLQRCATSSGGLSVLALDHRNNLRQALNPQDPSRVSDQQLSDFKLQVVAHLAPHASAVLLDPQYGAFQALTAGALPPKCGLIVALEATGYSSDTNSRISQVLPGWSVAKAKRMGADAVKLLIYYHPSSKSASQIESLVEQVERECQRQDMLLMLEPLCYSIDPALKHISGNDRRKVVVETARRLTEIGGDILKAEFPLDFQSFPKESDWAAACEELTTSSRIPWLLLSASVDFDTYLRQVIIACQHGAAGVAAGRAVWKEAIEVPEEERESLLQQLCEERMHKLTQLVNEQATSWQSFFQIEQVGSDFYNKYPD